MLTESYLRSHNHLWEYDIKEILKNQEVVERLEKLKQHYLKLLKTDHPLEHISGCTYKDKLYLIQGILKEPYGVQGV